MDFNLTEAQKMLQKTVRQFVNKHILPFETEIMRRPYEATTNREDRIGRDNYRRLQQTGKDMGLWALWVPAELGGAGLGYTEFLLVTIELNKTFVLFDFGGDVPFPDILARGTESIKQRYLYPCLRGEKSWFFAQTEPNAGSDAAAIQTTAVKDGDDWVLNGTKIFISEADAADFLLLTAVTEKGRGARGISTFLVDREKDGQPGYKVQRVIPCMGGVSLSPCELLLDNVRIPGDNIVGNVNEGFIVAQKFLEIRGRLHHAGWDLGMALRSINLATDYSKQRFTFGQPLSERQAIQWMLADSAVEIHACTLMALHCAWKADAGENIRHEAAMVKLYSDEMVGRVLDRSIQILGAVGTSMEMPVERFYRLARILRIGGGSMEMMRLLIARNLLRGLASFSTVA